MFQRRPQRQPAVLLLGYVADRVGRLAPHGLNFSHGLLQLVLAARREEHLRAIACEQLGRFIADAVGAGTGNERNAT